MTALSSRSTVSRRLYLRIVGLAGTATISALVVACSRSASAPTAPTTAAAQAGGNQSAAPTAAATKATVVPAQTSAPVSGKAVSIVLWAPTGNPGQKFWETEIGDFNKQQSKYHVKIDYPFAGTQSLVQEMQKVRLSLQARSGADVIHSDAVGSQLSAYESTGQLLDLTDAYRQFGWEKRILKSTQDSVQLKGKFYGLPESIEIVGYFYDKGQFDKVGIKPPGTYQEFLANGAKLKDAKIPMQAMGIRDGWPAAYYASAFIYAVAGNAYRKTLEGQATWINPKFEEGLKDLKDLVTLGYTNSDPLSYDANQEVNLFFQQKVASIMRDDSFAGQIKDTKPSWQSGFYALPLINPQSDVKIYGGVGGSWVATAFTKSKEGSLALLNFAFSEKVATDSAAQGLSFIPVPIKVPASAPSLTKELYQAVEKYAANGLGYYPVTFLSPGAFGKLHSFVQGLISGQLTPKGVLEQMDSVVKQEKSG